MYNLPYFKEPDHQVILQFMQAHPFAMLIGCNNPVSVATQVPLLIEQKGEQLFLKGHIMRNTDHHKALERNSQVLRVFTGAHSYVSASWYRDSQVASTWNYMSVHARGTLTFLPEQDLVQILHDTTDHFENGVHTPSAFANLSDEYVQRLAKAIIGFQIEVTALDHVFKLSQNRDKENYNNIITQLKSSDADAQTIAAEMEQRRSQLFNKG
jgi:transcriptional regulator